MCNKILVAIKQATAFIDNHDTLRVAGYYGGATGLIHAVGTALSSVVLSVITATIATVVVYFVRKFLELKFPNGL